MTLSEGLNLEGEKEAFLRLEIKYFGENSLRSEFKCLNESLNELNSRYYTSNVLGYILDPTEREEENHRMVKDIREFRDCPIPTLKVLSANI